MKTVVADDDNTLQEYISIDLTPPEICSHDDSASTFFGRSGILVTVGLFCVVMVHYFLFS